jgi:hypothetical protein
MASLRKDSSELPILDQDPRPWLLPILADHSFTWVLGQSKGKKRLSKNISWTDILIYTAVNHLRAADTPYRPYTIAG